MQTGLCLVDKRKEKKIVKICTPLILLLYSIYKCIYIISLLNTRLNKDPLYFYILPSEYGIETADEFQNFTTFFKKQIFLNVWQKPVSEEKANERR